MQQAHLIQEIHQLVTEPLEGKSFQVVKNLRVARKLKQKVPLKALRVILFS
jgi:hypothetical protein